MTLHLAVIVLLGAITGFLAWGEPGITSLSVMLPMLWLGGKNRWHGAAGVFTYYLVGSRCLPDSSGAFFESDFSYQLGVAMWIGAALLNALPWLIAWSKTARYSSIALRMLAIITVLTIPPLGFIGWLNPWLGAASLFPGWGWGAFALGFLMLTGTAFLIRKKAILALPMAVLATIPAFISHDAAPPAGWHGVETQWGKPPAQNSSDKFMRWSMIAEAAENGFAAGREVVVLPEQIAGLWSKPLEQYLTGFFAEQFSEGKVLIVGTGIDVAGNMLNTAVILSKEGRHDYYARQSVPVSMWRPWSDNSYAPNWLAPGLKVINGREVAISMCYEDFMLGLGLTPFITGKPEAIVSMANGWWAGNSNEVAVQRLHITTLAKVFGVPVIRSLNLPDDQK